MTREILTRLDRLESMLNVLVERQTFKDYYEIEEFCRLVHREPLTCREWARHGRIRAHKKLSGRGSHARWVVTHAELLRYQREGLLPTSGSDSSVLSGGDQGSRAGK
jgi:hypothetical protein